MISAKRLVAMATKWQKVAAGKHKRISYKVDHIHSSEANKGHFVVYSMDHKRFLVPLEYLSTNVFRELLRWAEEEFGLPSNGPIRLPCETVFLEYVISLVQEHIPEDVERALITSMATCHNEASSSYGLSQSHQQTIIYGF